MTPRENSEPLQPLLDLLRQLVSNEQKSREDLKERMIYLTSLVGRSELDPIPNVLPEWFETLSAQLAPLRELAPPTVVLSGDASNCLRAINQGMEAPKWTGATSISPPDRPVNFIGTGVAPRPPSPAPSYPQAYGGSSS